MTGSRFWAFCRSPMRAAILSLWGSYYCYSTCLLGNGSMVAKIGLEPISARCWIPEELGPAGFFSKLKFLDINYVVLRWFETLPEIEKGEDIDLLVEDSDLGALLSLVERRTQTSIPIDVYSETGKIGSDWRGIPYFPRKLSQAILDNSVEL
jgi:hypothetical protein